MAVQQGDIPLPDGYPHGLSDRDLATTLQQMLDGWRYVSGATDNLNRASGEVTLGFIQAGMQEQSRREVERSTRTARQTSMLATAIALLATIIALAFGVLDYFGEESWQDEQTQILTEIRDRLPDR